MSPENKNRITIFNNGGQSHYLRGLVSGLSNAVGFEFDIIDSAQNEKIFNSLPNISFYNYRGDIFAKRSRVIKIINLISFYLQVIRYAYTTDSKIFHIQWDTRLLFLDRFILIIYYRILKKKIVYTAHNVNSYIRDGRNNILKIWLLKYLYKNVHRLIVHTDNSKKELVSNYNIDPKKIFVIPHGLNVCVNRSKLNREIARKNLNISNSHKVLLLFGAIEPYKGHQMMIEVVNMLKKQDNLYYLMIVGLPSNVKFLENIKNKVESLDLRENVYIDPRYISESEVADYLEITDCVVLPYKYIYQSGVLFLAYAYGLPVIATNVGNFKNDIVENVTGYVSKDSSSECFAETIKLFFNSKLYSNREETKNNIINYAAKTYSWDMIGKNTIEIYKTLL
jgi:D-inositol-3-phosphate glycosyltransferase